MKMFLLLLSLLVSVPVIPTSALDDQIILINGGWNGEVVLNSTEVLGSTDCQVPDLPENRELHANALTADGLVLTCGGDVLSVLVLDVAAQTWTRHSTLDTDRYSTNVISMADGVYLLGGTEGEGQSSSSSFLPTGSSEWRAGPELPEGGLEASCIVATSDTRFLIIGGRPNSRQVAEYDTATGQWAQWPVLSHGRYGHSCAKLGDKVVFSGGYDDDGYYLASTSIIDITRETPRERPGGDMSVERVFFGMFAQGDGIVAFGGEYGADFWDTIEDWDPVTEQWTVRDGRMEAGRTYFGSVIAPATAVCSG